MDVNRKKKYENLLHSEISPALGCTEPAATALAVAYASDALRGDSNECEISSVLVEVSPYIFKNGMNVGIPGTGMIGLDIASALGAISAAPKKMLMVLNDLSDAQKDKARKMVSDKIIKVTIATTDKRVYMKATVSSGEDKAVAIISQSHTDLVYLEKNGNVIFEKSDDVVVEQKKSDDEKYDVTVKEILDFVNEVNLEDLQFLKDVIDINTQISKEGLENDYGLKVGKSLIGKSGDALLSNGVINYAVACTAAAADARMAGCDKPVMSAAGSGNQGLTASIPVVAISEKMFSSKEQTFRALALSILVTVHTKHYIGRLSVLCGCSIAASIGACCGVIYLLNGNYDNVAAGINTMVADISGVICDGAKPGCALKIATAVNSAMRAASMALSGVGADSHDGIVSNNTETTLENLGKLGNEGMAQTNDAILGMMLGNHA